MWIFGWVDIIQKNSVGKWKEPKAGKMKNEHHPAEEWLVWQSLFTALLNVFYSILKNLHE